MTTPTILDPQRAAIESAVEWLLSPAKDFAGQVERSRMTEWATEQYPGFFLGLPVCLTGCAAGEERRLINGLCDEYRSIARSYVISRGEAWLAEWVERHRPALVE